MKAKKNKIIMKNKIAIVDARIGLYIKTVREYKVYVALISFRNSETKLCCPGRERINELTGLSESDVSRAVTKLKNRGLITIQKRRNNSNKYFFTNLDDLEPVKKQHSGDNTNQHYSNDNTQHNGNDENQHLGTDELQHTNKKVNKEVNIKDKVVSKLDDSALQKVTTNTLPALSLDNTINSNEDTKNFKNNDVNNSDFNTVNTIGSNYKIDTNLLIPLFSFYYWDLQVAYSQCCPTRART